MLRDSFDGFTPELSTSELADANRGLEHEIREDAAHFDSVPELPGYAAWCAFADGIIDEADLDAAWARDMEARDVAKAARDRAAAVMAEFDRTIAALRAAGRREGYEPVGDDDGPNRPGGAALPVPDLGECQDSELIAIIGDAGADTALVFAAAAELNRRIPVRFAAA